MTIQEISETDEFKTWFGDSKIVDSNGLPLLVYHGAKRELPNGVPTIDFADSNNNKFGYGMYFSTNRLYAKSHAIDNHIYNCFIKLTNPFIWSDIDSKLKLKEFLKRANFKFYHKDFFTFLDYGDYRYFTMDPMLSKKMTLSLKRLGYDGVIFYNFIDNHNTSSDVYVVFDNDNIKNANISFGLDTNPTENTFHSHLLTEQEIIDSLIK